MFKSYANTHEAGSALRDSVLIVLTTFIAASLLVNMAASAALNLDAHGLLMQTVSRIFLTLALTALPLVICLVALPWSGRDDASKKSAAQE